MKFNISVVSIKDTVDGYRWQIEGFSQDDTKTIFRTVIHHGKFSKMFLPDYKYNEGDALIFVDKNNVYNIAHDTYKSTDAWNGFKENESVPDTDVNPFNMGYYMNLPPVVYCTWKGILNTDL
jgi:hypothetical protein